MLAELFIGKSNKFTETISNLQEKVIGQQKKYTFYGLI